MPRREMLSPIFLDRFQRQNRDVFEEQVYMLDDKVYILEIFEKQNWKMLTFSELVWKCFPVCQEVVGIKERPEIKF